LSDTVEKRHVDFGVTTIEDGGFSVRDIEAGELGGQTCCTISVFRSWIQMEMKFTPFEEGPTCDRRIFNNAFSCLLLKPCNQFVLGAKDLLFAARGMTQIAAISKNASENLRMSYSLLERTHVPNSLGIIRLTPASMAASTMVLVNSSRVTKSPRLIKTISWPLIASTRAALSSKPSLTTLTEETRQLELVFQASHATYPMGLEK
jgi:hypothetical protein